MEDLCMSSDGYHSFFFFEESVVQAAGECLVTVAAFVIPHLFIRAQSVSWIYRMDSILYNE